MAIRTFSWPGVSINSAGLATEAKQDAIIGELQTINSEQETQTQRLETIDDSVNACNLELQDVNTELNTQTTELQGINTELNTQTVELQDINTELNTQTVELQSVNTELNTQTTELQTLNAVDFATETTLQAANTNLADIELKVLTDTQLRASPVPVSGPLTDVELRATAVPVSGPLTDTELRATAVPVSGPLTDVELRATPIPVSGTISTGGLTDTELRASAVPVSVSSSALPTGAATEVTLQEVSDFLGTIGDSPESDPTAVATFGELFRGFFQDFQNLVSTFITSIDTTISTISGQLPGALGSTTSANSLPVVVASDQVLVSKQSGKAVPNTSRYDYSSGSVTTGSWVQLLASTSSAVTEIEIFDSSGQTMELGIGAAASETRLILVFPGGNGRIPVSIANATRISIRAVSGTASVGEISINFYS